MSGMLIFVAYEGFELIANASTEVQNPRRTLPRAFGLATGVVITLYVLVAGVVVGSLSAAEISRSAEFSLAQAASVSLGSVGFKLVAVSAMIATLSAINATLYGAARLSFTLATEGELPPRFEQLKWTQPVGTAHHCWDWTGHGRLTAAREYLSSSERHLPARVRSRERRSIFSRLCRHWSKSVAVGTRNLGLHRVTGCPFAPDRSQRQGRNCSIDNLAPGRPRFRASSICAQEKVATSASLTPCQSVEGSGSYQGPCRPMRRSVLSTGPHVPGPYRSAEACTRVTPSTMVHAASTPETDVNSV